MRLTLHFGRLGASVLLLAGCAAARAASHPDFSGDWDLTAALGAGPPPGLVVHITQSEDAVRIQSNWEEPENAHHSLTLLGILVPNLRLRTDGREDLVQAGPFVLRCRTRWDENRLVTKWTTSEFQGVSFEGAWTRALSPNGGYQTLQISAVSSNGGRSAAMLTFRRL